MSIQPGQRLSHYEIHEKIGEGGMGEVYRATDGTLGREVAIKVLPREVAGDSERLARFQREAQVLASLNHPNIAAIHGLEKDAGIPFLVMELIEGEDLSERLKRGRIDVPEAVAIARQVAEALEEAHERGIVHRDLKPANIKLAPGGKVKVLDFGLAKAFDASPAGPTDLSRSPTMTSAATRAGVILGTAAYMSPEQARGGTVDKRADIWAFGCVLLEMLTGRGIFSADTLSDTLASVLKSEPDWKTVPEDTPAPLIRLLRRCLQKDPRARLRDIGEARIVLEGGISTIDEETRPLPEAGPAGLGAKWVALIAAASMVAAAGLTAIVLRGSAGAPSGAVQKFEIVHEGLQTDSMFAPALSPDARRIVYVSDDRLWVRELDQLEARELAGTEGAHHPFWSPDSEMVGYVKDGSLWRMPVQGGQAAAIAGGIGEFGPATGISWGDRGRIVYSRGNTGLYEVSARGGDPQLFHDYVRSEEGDLHEPSYLPQDRGVLMVAHRLGASPDTLCVVSGGERKVLLQLEGQSIRTPVYSPTGHILYLRQAANVGLWAVPFSVETLELTGEPFLVAPDGSLPSVADDGTLLYVRGAGLGMRQLVWVNHEGVIEEEIGQPQARIASPTTSPDGGRIAVMAQDNENWDIWIHDVARGTRTRLTFSTLQDWDPAWTPDGRRVVFWDGVTRAISMKAADGTGEVERLVSEQFLDSGLPTLSPDGERVVFWVKTEEGRQELYVMPLEGDGSPAVLLRGNGTLDFPKVSPDGRYLSYTSNESGRNEVFLTRFPSAEGKWQVSAQGGQQAVWDPRGGRLYYRNNDAIMMVEVGTEPSVQLGTPRELFTADAAGINIGGYTRFDISRDGERFVMIRNVLDDGVEPSLVLVRNWLAEFEAGE